MKITYSCWPALLLFCFGGCMQVKTCIDDCVIGCRNRCYAEKAWLQNKSCYNDVECKCDFGKGFRDGYVAVASGGSSCQPALPPKEYWGFEYQNPDGQERMLAWFNGYSYGALYAEQEGISDWSRVVTAPTLPPYRKKRPGKIPATSDSDTPSTDMYPLPQGNPPRVPYVEPAPPDDSVDAPSASAEVIKLEAPIDEHGSPANSQIVRWTDAADAY